MQCNKVEKHTQLISISGQFSSSHSPLPHHSLSHLCGIKLPASQRRVTPHGVQSASPAVTVHRSVAGTARGIRVGYEINKERLHASVLPQTAPFQLVHCTGTECLSSARGNTQPPCKACCRGSAPHRPRERLLQSLFSGAKEKWRTPPNLGPEAVESRASKRSFKMITLRQILSHIRPGDWCISVDLKDAYFHIQVAPRHRRFLRFAFEGIAYQFTVLPFGLCLAPRMFTKCMGAALTPLNQNGMRVLNYLNDWLVLAQSESALLSDKFRLLAHIQVQTPCSYSELRADCKYAKEHAGTEPEHLLFRSGAELNQNASASVGGALTKIDQFSRSLQIRVFSPAKMLSVDARPDGCCLDSVQSRAPTYASSSALVKEPGATERMAHGHLAH